MEPAKKHPIPYPAPHHHCSVPRMSARPFRSHQAPVPVSPSAFPDYRNTLPALDVWGDSDNKEWSDTPCMPECSHLRSISPARQSTASHLRIQFLRAVFRPLSDFGKRSLCFSSDGICKQVYRSRPYFRHLHTQLLSLFGDNAHFPLPLLSRQKEPFWPTAPF